LGSIARKMDFNLAEERLNGRLSFQKVVQLGVDETVPDEMICRSGNLALGALSGAKNQLKLTVKAVAYSLKPTANMRAGKKLKIPVLND